MPPLVDASETVPPVVAGAAVVVGAAMVVDVLVEVDGNDTGVVNGSGPGLMTGSRSTSPFTWTVAAGAASLLSPPRVAKKPPPASNATMAAIAWGRFR